MKTKIAEPGFLWGAATSSHQIDGANEHNDWWAWEAKGNVEGGVRSGIATDHLHRFRADLELAQNLGLSSYRFSIEWSRLEPQEGAWNEAAFAWYDELLNECERLGLKPMVTLHHFTLPLWFAQQGGFSSERAPAAFARFVTKVALRFGTRVPLWCTLNEPVVYVIGAYLGRFMPPGIYSPAHASLAFANMLRCHALAYGILHEHGKKREGPWAGEQMMVGYAHNMLSFVASKKFHPLEIVIARELGRIYNTAWLDATTGRGQNFSLLGLLPKAPLVAELVGRVTTDFIGVNYYTKAYVQWRPRAKDPNQMGKVPIGISFARRKESASDLDWAIHADGLLEQLEKAARYRLPLFITENGIADKADAKRPGFIHSHLSRVAAAIAGGADIRGYYHWSLLDNFEWIKGFWPRFGLYSVDYTTLERTETKSAKLYREIIRIHKGGPPKTGLLNRVSIPEDDVTL